MTLGMTLLLHIVLLSLWICFRSAQSVAEDLNAPSEALANLVYLLNGQFTNLATLAKDEYGRLVRPDYLVEWDIQSVALNFFDPVTTIYLEENIGKKPLYRQIITIRDIGNGLFLLHPYNIKDEFFSHGEAQPQREFSSLKMEDLSELTECDTFVQQIDTALYMGFWPTCNPGQHDFDVSLTLSCHMAAYIGYPRNTTKSEREVVPMRKITTPYPPPYTVMGSDLYTNPCEGGS
ncbi:unnamed protein product [Lymnaea stagnalis]|uniref:Uncharacterized protein n=1 Tax=Lymnaea stagnalis TaxID=6523 RepID=A0AAV2IPN2_LYMST